MSNVPDEMNKHIHEILDGEWFAIYYDEDEKDYEVGLDGNFSIKQLQNLIDYLKETLKNPEPKER